MIVHVIMAQMGGCTDFHRGKSGVDRISATDRSKADADPQKDGRFFAVKICEHPKGGGVGGWTSEQECQCCAGRCPSAIRTAARGVAPLAQT